jgi:hypothetical protein
MDQIATTTGPSQVEHTMLTNLAMFWPATLGGFMFGEKVGGAIVGGVGKAANFFDNGLLGDGDKSSQPYIELGAKLGARDKAANRLGGVCSCGGGE